MGGDNASDYKRYGGRINSEHVLLKAKDHAIITIGENLSYWYHRSHDLAEGNGYWNIMQAAYVASPLVEPYDADGNLTSYTKNGAGYSDMIYGMRFALSWRAISSPSCCSMLEVNTTPGMTATSFIPQQVKAAGLSMTDVLTEIVENQ